MSAAVLGVMAAGSDVNFRNLVCFAGFRALWHDYVCLYGLWKACERVSCAILLSTTCLAKMRATGCKNGFERHLRSGPAVGRSPDAVEAIYYLEYPKHCRQ